MPRPATSARCRAAFKVSYVFACAGTNVGWSLFHRWLALRFPKCLFPDVIPGTCPQLPGWELVTPDKGPDLLSQTEGTQQGI